VNNFFGGRKEPALYVAKPPTVEAYQFGEADDETTPAFEAARRFGQFWWVTYLVTGQQPYYEFELDENWDWVNHKIFFGGKKVKLRQRAEILPGWWIVVDDVRETVEFMSDNEFQARYEAVT
jgi:hypothetical protein